MEKISAILEGIRDGNREGWDQLAPLVYDELRRQASRQLRRENGDPNLQTSVLVHELYLRLVGQTNRNWQNRTHFYAVCAQVMRRILVDAARRRKALRRGGISPQAGGPGPAQSAEPRPIDWQALDQALRRLAKLNERQHRVVELHYFAGLSFEEIAGLLAITTKTVQRDWVAARTWLYGQLKEC